MNNHQQMVNAIIVEARDLVCELQEELVLLTDTDNGANDKHYDTLIIEVAKMLLSVRQ